MSWSLGYKYILLRIRAIALSPMTEGPHAWLPELKKIDEGAAQASNEERWKCIVSATRLI